MESNGDKIGQPDMQRWLDAALRARVDAEPRAGLEERVLARLRSESERRRFSWWPVMSAVAAILTLAVTLALLRTSRPDPNVASGSQEPAKHSTTAADIQRTPPVLAANRTEGPMHRSHATSKDAACCISTQKVVATSAQVKDERPPMLPTFPAPRPQTDDERLLARLAARRGSFDLAAVARGSALPEELWVPSLEVEPMEGTPPDNPRK